MRRSAPGSSRCVAKQCLSVCGCTSFWRPARWAASLQAFQTTLVVIGVSPVCQRLPGNSQALGLRCNPRQCSRSASSSFGLSITSRSLQNYSRRSEEHTSELQSRQYLVCRLLLEIKKKTHTKDLLICTAPSSWYS